LIQLLKQVMNETGKILVNNGYRDLGSFVAEALNEGQNAAKERGKEAAAETVLERLVRAFPAFRDMAVVDNQPVYCFKKALFLINGVSIRFSSLSPPPFPVPETSHLPVFTDNVLPSMLIHLGVIDLSECDRALASVFSGENGAVPIDSLLSLPPTQANEPSRDDPRPLPKAGPILTYEQAYVLRAAAVDACELFVQTARSISDTGLRTNGVEWFKDITLPDLDTWVWAVAKDRQDYRKLERFVLKNTPFF